MSPTDALRPPHDYYVAQAPQSNSGEDVVSSARFTAVCIQKAARTSIERRSSSMAAPATLMEAATEAVATAAAAADVAGEAAAAAASAAERSLAALMPAVHGRR